MKLLHTSDWHVGKTLKGRDRSSEYEAILAEIAEIAAREQVDLVVVAGDLFESAAPPPEAERIVYRALLDLAGTGAAVCVVAGNHDNERRLLAVEPLLGLGRVVARPMLATVDEGGVFRFTAPSGEPCNVALIPWISHRYVIKADELMALDAGEHRGMFAERIRLIVERLQTAFTPEAVNILAGHLMMSGAQITGSERLAHTILDYCVSAQIFTPDARRAVRHPHYVALGHVHRQQQLAAGCPVWYSGSALQLDFGETEDRKGVLIVEASPGTPATVRSVPLERGRRLRHVRGTLSQLEALAGTTGEDFLRVTVLEQKRAGLAEEVRALFGETAVDVMIEAGAPAERERLRRAGMSPHDLFIAYLNERDAQDERVVAMFDRFLDEVSDHAAAPA